ncbi:MAG: AmmeMemoRadiSam system protein B [Candidatus Woesearchaeota archaeon]
MNIPVVAGQFYDANADRLKRQIEESFLSEFGPGALPVKRTSNVLKGIISPHAGYAYSGPGAAWSYKEVAESKMPSTYVILAPDHNGTCSRPTVSKGEWHMPMGKIRANQDFVNKLLVRADFVREGGIAEHAIEVQLPFLQYASKDNIEGLKIVPIVVPSSDNYEELGKAIASIDKDICIVMSSDFTHYGKSYGYTPFRHKIQEHMYNLDNEAIDYICKLDTKGFRLFTKKMLSTICGAYPIMVGLEALKHLKSKEGKLLHYYTSADVMGDYDMAVGYGSVVFR